jgi:hypothetical protein
MRYQAVITVTNKIATKKQYFLLSSESDKDPSRLVSLKILRTRGQSFRVLVNPVGISDSSSSHQAIEAKLEG